MQEAWNGSRMPSFRCTARGGYAQVHVRGKGKALRTQP